ncbi:unnamed protein product, partial [Ectocarpus sp. 12 AP-2014]
MEDALANGLRHMSGRVGANCGERRAVVSHQLRLLEGLAAPPHTRVLMWLAVQDESFFRARQQQQQQQQQPPNLASARPPNIATDIISPGSGGSGGGGDARSAAMALPTSQTNQEESPDIGGGDNGGVSPSSATSNTVVASSSWSAGEEGGGGGGGGGSSGSSNSSNGSLWRLLCQELGLTDSQEGQFLQFQRAVAASPPTLAERDRLRRLSRVLAGLRASTEACMADVHARAATLMEILTPSQTVR